MIDLCTADELDQLAARIAQIRPMSNSNPHAFYEERSEVAHQVRELASRLRNRRPVEIDPPAPIARQVVSHQVRHVAGRTVLVLTRAAAAGLR